MQTHKLAISATLAPLALLTVLAALARGAAPAQAAAPLSPAEDCYVPIPRECVGVNPPGALVPACCAFGCVFDTDSGAVSGTVVTATTRAGAAFTATTVPGPQSCAAYFTLDLAGHGVLVGYSITLTTGIGGRARTLVYADVAPGGQQIDLDVPRPGRADGWTVYLTDTFASVTALALDTSHLWVGSGGQEAAWLDLTTGAAVTYVHSITAPLYNDVCGLIADGLGDV